MAAEAEGDALASAPPSKRGLGGSFAVTRPCCWVWIHKGQGFGDKLLESLGLKMEVW